MHANTSRRLYVRHSLAASTVSLSPSPVFARLARVQNIGHAMTVEFKPRGRRSNVAILVRTASDSILVHPRTMYVIKRDGREEPVAFDKITARIKKLSYGLSAEFCDPVRARLCEALRCGAIDDFQNGARATTTNEMRDANARNISHDIYSFDVAIEGRSHRVRVHARSFKDSSSF